jgi:uncharacterized membrane protein
MSYKTYRLYKALIVIIIAILVGWAVPAANPYVPIPAAIVGILILLFIRRGVKEVVVDERTYNIANRASRVALQVVTLAAVLVGATLVSYGYGRYPDVRPVGFTLIYNACGLMVVYFISYVYYGRKLGGKV